MASQRVRYFSLMTVFLLGLVACGGGTQVAGGGIGGTGISQGPITGFGSIFVNGVEFNTDNATIIKDGTAIGPVSTSELKNYLKVGMVVTVDGSIANSISGTAASVTYAKELEGPISAITLPNTLSVLGQTVIVDNLTKIEVAGLATPSISDLAVGDVVEVSGYSTAAGIRATYIDAKPSGTTKEYELNGMIGAINASNPTLLTIGTQTVDINGASFNFTPKVGDYVEVKGTISAGGILAATSLELKSRALNLANADKAEVEGYVTATTSATEFVLNAQVVQITAQTTFSGGIASDIVPGVIVEVEGSLVDGTLIATKISFEDDLELEGNVAAINTSTNTLTLASYPAISISFSAILTDLEGVPNFTAINPGDHIKVRGRPLDASNCSSGTCVLATQLTLESAVAGSTGGSSGSTSTGSSGSGSSTDSSGGSTTSTTDTTTVELQGPIDNIVPGQSFTVLGVTVDATSLTSFSGDGITDSSTFFDTVKSGDLVDVTGTQVGTIVTWQAVELDN
ncbi:MAG: DUF5666 domain-containing protein [Gammaproteobacteria bacterium]|jgi:hypothetical protein